MALPYKSLYIWYRDHPITLRLLRHLKKYICEVYYYPMMDHIRWYISVAKHLFWDHFIISKNLYPMICSMFCCKAPNTSMAKFWLCKERKMVVWCCCSSQHLPGLVTIQMVQWCELFYKFIACRHLFLQFESVDLEPHLDVIDIYVGGPTLKTSKYVTTLTGNERTTLGSNNNYMILLFSSDSTDNQPPTRGFKAIWNTRMYMFGSWFLVQSVGCHKLVQCRYGSKTSNGRFL